VRFRRPKVRRLLIGLKDRPPEILEPRDQDLPLQPYSKFKSGESVRAVTCYPLFDLQDFSSTLVLCSVPDHPMRLHSALSGQLVASYPFVNAMTEALISPHSLRFTADGRSIIAGTKNAIAIFDASRPGQQPKVFLPTTASRKASKAGHSPGMKGIVSALAVDQSSNVLAAGTFSRHVGLYSAAGEGECLGLFQVNGNEADRKIGGRGITQLIWSPCGTYLYIVERQSRGVMIYDIRKTGQLLSWAEGRNAETYQRLGADLSSSPDAESGLELWAGGLDGKVRVWRNTHCQEGSQQPDDAYVVHTGMLTHIYL
jgi:telomerase Cajal body protein 1